MENNDKGSFRKCPTHKLLGLKFGLSGLLIAAIGFILLIFNVKEAGGFILFVGFLLVFIGVIANIFLMFRGTKEKKPNKNKPF